MTIIEIQAYNSRGECLLLSGKDIDSSSVYVTSLSDAVAFMGKTKSAMAYGEDERWRRNRVHSFALCHYHDADCHGRRWTNEDCPRTPQLDAYRRKAYAERGCAVYATYAEAKAALAA